MLCLQKRSITGQYAVFRSSRIVPMILEYLVQPDKSFYLLKLIAQSGNLEWFKLMNLVQTVNWNCNILSWLSRENMIEYVKLVLKHGVNIDQQNADDNTALMLAVKNGSYELCELLLEHGADINKSKKSGETALVLAAEEGMYEICELFLKQPSLDKTDSLPYQVAIKTGNVEIFKLLLDHGLNTVLLPGHQYETLLHHAALWGQLEICKLLVEKTDLTPMTLCRYTPVFYAAACNWSEIVAWFRDLGVDFSQLPEAGDIVGSLALDNHIEMLRQLVGYGLDPHAVDNCGENGIFSAAENRHVEFARVLFEEYGVQYLPNINGRSPLMRRPGVCFHVEMFKLLVEHGADLNEAIQLTISRNKIDLLKWCLERGQNSRDVNLNYHDFLSLAASRQNLKMFKLIEPLCDLSLTDGAGNTILHHAAQDECLEVCRYIVEQYPHLLHVQNNNGLTPHQIAVNGGMNQLINLLVPR